MYYLIYNKLLNEGFLTSSQQSCHGNDDAMLDRALNEMFRLPTSTTHLKAQAATENEPICIDCESNEPISVEYGLKEPISDVSSETWVDEFFSDYRRLPTKR